MPIRVAINGFGRIGRQVFKAGFENKKIEFVGINDLGDAANLAYLLQHDSVYGEWNHKISSKQGFLIVDGQKIPVFAAKDPIELPWGSLRVDVVIESTGRFTDAEGMKKHLKAGAKHVVLSAPSQDEEIKTIVRGVNDAEILGLHLLSNASCTTNCVAPVTAIIDDLFGILKAGLTTVHSYTADQSLVDGLHKDFRRGRSAALNIIPTTTGAAISVTKTVPKLVDKFDGISIRVPTPSGSLSDITFLVRTKTTVDEINSALIKASKTARWKGILQCSNEALVSQDVVGNRASCIVDLSFTQVIDGDLVKILAWYDNELGYSHRLIEVVEAVVKKAPRKN